MELNDLCFFEPEGWCGKTTLSIHAAAELSRRMRRVLLIDADPQGSALAWANCREKPDFNVVGMPKATIHKEIDLLRDDYDEIIIDGPPRIAELARSILLAADLVVIPLLPSPLDVWAAAETVDLVREAQFYNDGLNCCLAANRKIVNTAIGRDVRNALRELEVPILKTDIGQRVAFAESLAAGKTVLDHGDRKGKAEIKRFINELEKLSDETVTTAINQNKGRRKAKTKATSGGKT